MSEKEQNNYDVNDRPPYEPEIWKSAVGANCYAYACNDPFGHSRPPHPMGKFYMPVPGEAAGQKMWDIKTDSIAYLATQDGLTKAPDDNPPEKSGYYLVALAIWPDNDFHWYRKDRDGTWSHKPGKSGVENFDSSGKTITDPKTADRKPYTEFGGYFYVPKGGLEVGDKVSFEKGYHENKAKYDEGKMFGFQKEYFETVYKRRHIEYMMQKERKEQYLKNQEKSLSETKSQKNTIVANNKNIER